MPKKVKKIKKMKKMKKKANNIMVKYINSHVKQIKKKHMG